MIFKHIIGRNTGFLLIILLIIINSKPLSAAAHNDSESAHTKKELAEAELFRQVRNQTLTKQSLLDLVKQGANVNAIKDEETPLDMATRSHNVEISVALLLSGAGRKNAAKTPSKPILKTSNKEIYPILDPILKSTSPSSSEINSILELASTTSSEIRPEINPIVDPTLQKVATATERKPSCCLQ